VIFALSRGSEFRSGGVGARLERLHLMHLMAGTWIALSVGVRARAAAAAARRIDGEGERRSGKGMYSGETLKRSSKHGRQLRDCII
jgi:hypothetical protein